MAVYKIRIKTSATRELGKIPGKELQKIVTKIRLLSSNPRPRGCEKLSGAEKYRIRQGDYRIIYSIEDETLVIFVVKIGQRIEVYKKR